MNRHQHFRKVLDGNRQNFSDKGCLSGLLSETISLTMPKVAQLEVLLASLSYVQ